MEEIEPLKIPKLVKVRAFCEHYAVMHNGTKAAAKAGYSEATAASRAWTLLQEPEVKAYIAYLEKEKLAEANIQAIDVLLELKKMAFSNVSDFINYEPEAYIEEPNPDFDPDKEEGIFNERTIKRYTGGFEIKGFSQLHPDQLSAISEFTEVSTAFGKNRKFKLHNKLDALSQIRAMQGFDQPKKSEQKINVDTGNLEKVSYSLKKRAKDPE